MGDYLTVHFIWFKSNHKSLLKLMVHVSVVHDFAELVSALRYASDNGWMTNNDAMWLHVWS